MGRIAQYLCKCELLPAYKMQSWGKKIKEAEPKKILTHAFSCKTCKQSGYYRVTVTMMEINFYWWPQYLGLQNKDNVVI